MNREIMFRGKRLDNGEWMFGYLCENGYRRLCIQTITEIVVGGFAAPTITKEIAPTTVGLFTGLLDKNGRDGYLGDCVKFTQAHRGNYGKVVTATFVGTIAHNRYFQSCIMVGCTEFHIDNLIRGEIVGNIHDDPELLDT